jgi:FdhE protein
MSVPTQQAWLAAHPYLDAIARLQRVIDEAGAGGDGPGVAEPRWEGYAPDFVRGVPLLQSRVAGFDAAPAAAEILRRMVDRLSEAELPDTLAEEVRALRDRFRATPEAPLEAVRALVAAKPDEEAPTTGVLAFLGWAALAHALAPVLPAYAAWRADDQWARPTCPTCGAAPVHAQLVAEDAGRRRLLACGRCRTRWAWKRIACPFCTTEVPEKLAILEIEGEGGFRLDVCDNCKGYVKTLDSQGNEAFLLADWTTLHLDVLARDRGYERKGASLYDL